MKDLTWEEVEAYKGIEKAIAPKAHKDTSGHIHGKKFCKGICHRMQQNPPVGQPKYLQHAFCTTCGDEDGIWMNINALKENGRCQCCNRKPRRKNFKQ